MGGGRIAGNVSVGHLMVWSRMKRICEDSLIHLTGDRRGSREGKFQIPNPQIPKKSQTDKSQKEKMMAEMSRHGSTWVGISRDDSCGMLSYVDLFRMRA